MTVSVQLLFRLRYIASLSHSSLWESHLVRYSAVTDHTNMSLLAEQCSIPSWQIF